LPPVEQFDGWVSWKVLVYGWVGMLFAYPTHFIWLANPALLIAWIVIAASLRNGSPALRSAAIWTSWFGLILAASFLLPVRIVANEGGVATAVGSREAGYWLWLASMFCATASARSIPRGS
jgi:hypothetical protein